MVAMPVTGFSYSRGVWRVGAVVRVGVGVYVCCHACECRCKMKCVPACRVLAAVRFCDTIFLFVCRQPRLGPKCA